MVEFKLVNKPCKASLGNITSPSLFTNETVPYFVEYNTTDPSSPFLSLSIEDGKISTADVTANLTKLAITGFSYANELYCPLTYTLASSNTGAFVEFTNFTAPVESNGSLSLNVPIDIFS